MVDTARKVRVQAPRMSMLPMAAAALVVQQRRLVEEAAPPRTCRTTSCSLGAREERAKEEMAMPTPDEARTIDRIPS